MGNIPIMCDLSFEIDGKIHKAKGSFTYNMHLEEGTGARLINERPAKVSFDMARAAFDVLENLWKFLSEEKTKYHNALEKFYRDFVNDHGFAMQDVTVTHDRARGIIMIISKDDPTIGAIFKIEYLKD